MWINLLPLLRLRFVLPNTGNWLIGVEYTTFKLLNFSLANKKGVVEFLLYHLMTLRRNLGTDLKLKMSIHCSCLTLNNRLPLHSKAAGEGNQKPALR